MTDHDDADAIIMVPRPLNPPRLGANNPAPASAPLCSKNKVGKRKAIPIRMSPTPISVSPARTGKLSSR